jgi:hypothetical protein
MSVECAVCGKKTLKASKLSFSHKHHVYRQSPNLQSVKIVENGTLLAKYECLNDTFENIRLQDRLYPGEGINQGTEIIQILLD